MTFHVFLTFFFSFLAVVCCLFMMFSRNPVHSILYLVLVFCNVTFMLIIWEVEFIAVMLLIVYVGAIAVLFLFVVMMLNIKIVESRESIWWYGFVSLLMSFIFFFELVSFVDFSGFYVSSNLFFDLINSYGFCIDFGKFFCSYVHALGFVSGTDAVVTEPSYLVVAFCLSADPLGSSVDNVVNGLLFDGSNLLCSLLSLMHYDHLFVSSGLDFINYFLFSDSDSLDLSSPDYLVSKASAWRLGTALFYSSFYEYAFMFDTHMYSLFNGKVVNMDTCRLQYEDYLRYLHELSLQPYDHSLLFIREPVLSFCTIGEADKFFFSIFNPQGYALEYFGWQREQCDVFIVGKLQEYAIGILRNGVKSFVDLVGVIGLYDKMFSGYIFNKDDTFIFDAVFSYCSSSDDVGIFSFLSFMESSNFYFDSIMSNQNKTFDFLNFYIDMVSGSNDLLFADIKALYYYRTNTELMGWYMYTYSFFIFFVVSLMLLVAMVGSIVLVLNQNVNVKRQNMYEQVSSTLSNSLYFQK